jgi:hypothetical protein
VVAVIISGAITVILVLQYMLARIVEGPLSDLVLYLDLYTKHFVPFRGGTLSFREVLYYFSLTAFFLMLARNSLEGRRWKP